MLPLGMGFTKDKRCFRGTSLTPGYAPKFSVNARCERMRRESAERGKQGKGGRRSVLNRLRSSNRHVVELAQLSALAVNIVWAL